MTRQMAGGPAAHKEAVRRMRDEERIAERRAKAWRLLTVDELTCAQIGKRLGISNKTAWYDVMAVRQARKDAGLLDADFLADRQQANIRAVIRTHLPRRDRVESGRLVLQALEREARLHGLDKQREAGHSNEQVLRLFVAFMRGVMEIVTETERRRAIFDLGKRLIGPAIDADAVARTEAVPDVEAEARTG